MITSILCFLLSPFSPHPLLLRQNYRNRVITYSICLHSLLFPSVFLSSTIPLFSTNDQQTCAHQAAELSFSAPVSAMSAHTSKYSPSASKGTSVIRCANLPITAVCDCVACCKIEIKLMRSTQRNEAEGALSWKRCPTAKRAANETTHLSEWRRPFARYARREQALRSSRRWFASCWLCGNMC